MNIIFWSVISAVVLLVIGILGWRGNQKIQKIMGPIVFGLFLGVPYFLIFFAPNFKFGPFRSPDLSLDSDFAKSMVVGLGIILLILWIFFVVNTLKKK